jgi:hypothetical protein
MDCFASLAMTLLGAQVPKLTVEQHSIKWNHLIE